MNETSHQITQIETQKRDQDRVNIYLDGAFAFGLEREVVLKHHLHEGDDVTDKEIDEILLVEERTRAKEKALIFLNYRSRSVEELRHKLLEKGFSERTVQMVIDDFIRVGLLNDRQFALDFALSRMVQKPMGKRLLRQELLSKGIDEKIILNTIDESYGGRSEVDVARELIQKRMQKYRQDSENRLKVRKKLSDFLLRRGFGWDVIGEVMGDLLQEDDY